MPGLGIRRRLFAECFRFVEAALFVTGISRRSCTDDSLNLDLKSSYFVPPAEWAAHVGRYPSALTFAGGWRVRNVVDWQLVDTKFQPIGASKWGRGRSYWRSRRQSFPSRRIWGAVGCSTVLKSR